MPIDRPDLSSTPLEVLAYIQRLEAELESLRGRQRAREQADVVGAIPDEAPAGPAEPPTTMNVISATAGGLLKRTPRHLYDRQRRSGMGVFDLDAPDEDPPALLTVADAMQALIVITTLGRAFPLGVNQIAEAPVRARGEPLRRWITSLQPEERLAIIAPDAGAGYLTLVSRRGQVRRWRYNVFGRALQSGTLLYDIKDGGAPAAYCWSNGDADLFIVTAKGAAIRFAEMQVPVRGCLGIRIDPDDAVIGVASVRDQSGVFMLANDGKGTIRSMAGFAQNRAPGAGGKQAMKAERLVAGFGVSENDDVFAISRLGKIIRFAAGEVPAKEGVVQGVICMSLRGDETTAAVAAGMN
jgi:DNA gyrase subunit A